MPTPTSWGPAMWSLLHDVSNKVDIINSNYFCSDPKKIARIWQYHLKQCAQSAQSSKSVSSSSSLSTMQNALKQNDDTERLRVLTNPEGLVRLNALLVELFDSLRFVLPCYNCRMHYNTFVYESKFLDYLKITCRGPDTLTKLVVNLHNTVNAQLKKKKDNLNLANFVDQKEADKGNWKQNPNYKNPLTMSKLDFLLKSIQSDDICDPTSKTAQDQKKEIVTKVFYQMSIDYNTCIGLDQFYRFLGAVKEIYIMFANYFDCNTVVCNVSSERGGAGANKVCKMGLNTLVAQRVNQTFSGSE